MPTNQLAPPDMPWLTGGPPLRPNGLGPPALNYAAPPPDASTGQGAAIADTGQAAWQWLQDQRAESARQGLLDPDTGLPTQAGLVDAARQTAQGVMMGTTAPGDVPPPGIVAYHGSPHSFDQFDTSKIGTGEGAQAYGHGLYFAGNEGVARSYRDALTQKDFKTSTGESLPDWIGNSVKQVGDQFGTDSSLYGQTIDKHIADFQGRLAETQQGMATDPQPWMAESRIVGFNNIIDGLNKLKSGDATLQPRGSMYQVNIGADPEHFLDWDKPLSEQHPKVQEALQHPTFGDPDPAQTGGRFIASEHAAGDPAEVSAALQQAGIPGIRYLDQGSRGAGQGTHNYVVFDANTIDILRKYGIAGLIAGGGAAAAGTQQQQPSQ